MLYIRHLLEIPHRIGHVAAEASIGDDFYNYSQKDYALVGERNKRKYTLGDAVKVKLIGADLAARTLDFELVR